MIEIPHRAGGRARRASIHSLEAVCCGVPPEVRVPSMAKGDELGRAGGVRRGVLELILVDGRQQVGRQQQGYGSK